MQKYVIPHTGWWYNSSVVEKLKVLGAVVMTFTLVPLYFLLVVRGPLWPVARLVFLNDSDQMLEHQGIHNAHAQRVLCWVAFGLLVAMFVCGALGYYYDRHIYAGVAFAGICYGVITYIIFKFRFLNWMGRVGGWLKEAGIWIVIIVVFLVVWLLGNKKDPYH